jgi:hypothetical protein
MPTTLDIHSTVNIMINEHGYESNRIPKNIIVSDRELNQVEAKWLYDRNTVSFNLEPGVYLAELFLSSNQRFSQTFELFDGETHTVYFDIAVLSPRETHEWAYFTKNISPKPITFNAIVATGLTTTQWVLNAGKWIPRLGPILNSDLNADGIDFELDLDRNLHVLEVNVDKHQPVFISLPPSQHLRCLIKRNTRIDDADQPLEVVVSTDNWIAETILSYLVKGDTLDADSLAKAANYAESLLYDKVEDPASAAIGGYYLLKTYHLERMHNWPRNLSNWFEWMPDGAIIRAWQLLIDGKQRGIINRAEIETLLLEAYSRGLPIYSEGLRLLHEGLRILFFNPGKDVIKNDQVENAWERIKSICSYADWKKSTTTLTFPFRNANEPPPYSQRLGPFDLGLYSSGKTIFRSTNAEAEYFGESRHGEANVKSINERGRELINSHV